MTVCEQTRKPIARPISRDMQRRLCLPPGLAWYVECDFIAGWGSTLSEALANWRRNRLLRQTFRHKDDDE